MKNQALGMVNLAVFGVFMLVAGLVTVLPHVAVDRLDTQFKPIWQRVFTQDEEWEIVSDGVAVASQWLIGVTEFVIGVTALLAVVSSKRRAGLAQISLGAATTLFGTFMIVLFFLHEAELPKWNQYPAILVWISVIWILLEKSHSGEPGIGSVVRPERE